MDGNELLESVARVRRTVEFDKTRQIPKEDWEVLLKVAQAAPSSNGLEPWRILQIDDPVLRQKIRKVAPGDHGQLETASKFIFFTKVKPRRPYTRYVMREVHGLGKAGFLKFEATFLVLQNALLDIRLGSWQERQSSIPLGQIMLAAGLLGIDCCPMEGFFYKKAGKVLSEAGLLDLKEEKLAVAVAFGYRANEPKHPKTRRPLNDIVKVV